MILPTDLPAGVSRAEYDALPGLNQSKARALLSSPARFRWECDNPSDATPDMIAGTIAHVLVLEPDSFADRFVVVPEDAPTKPTSRQVNAKKPSEDTLKAIEWWAKFVDQCAGKEVISRTIAENGRAYADGILRTMSAYGIKPLAVEVALTAEYHGIAIKGSLDIIGEDGFIYDAKTTKEDATREGFGKAVDKSKELKLQAAWYRYLFSKATGVYPEGFRWIAQEKEPPFLGGVLEARIPKGTAQLQAILGLGEGQQPPGVKEPAQLLLGIKHPVAINSQGQLPWLLGTTGLGIGH
jgi:exodeoxyribonuclease VIII